MYSITPKQDVIHGSGWSLFPPGSDSGGMNIVSGNQLIAAMIVSLCLTRPGEDFFHPERAIAPDLFEPFSEEQPEYVVYKLEEAIAKWVAPGRLEAFSVRVSGYNDVDNALVIEVYFVPIRQATTDVLTFPWYQYQGARLNGDIKAFASSVSLNGRPFTRLVA